MSKTENQSPNKGTWEWNNTMLLHQQKQNRSPQHLHTTTARSFCPNPFSCTGKAWKAVFISPKKGIYSSWWHRTAICP